MIDSLCRPATPSWLAGRITALLAHFYVPSADPKLHAALLDDWMNALSGRPAWSVARAVAWWLGPDNPDHRRPLPGDIARRADVEQDGLRAAVRLVERHEAGDPPRALEPPPDRPRLTPDEVEARRRAAAEIMRGLYGTGGVDLGLKPGQGTGGNDDQPKIHERRDHPDEPEAAAGDAGSVINGGSGGGG